MPRPRTTRAHALLAKARAGHITEAEKAEGLALFSRPPADDTGEVFMFLRWGTRRMAQLYPALLVEPESGNVLALMSACALTLDKYDQRMRKPMVEVGRMLNLDPAQLSRATRILIAHGVLLFPERAGQSRTFELDASLVTMLPEPARKAAAAAQKIRRTATVTRVRVVDAAPAPELEPTPAA